MAFAQQKPFIINDTTGNGTVKFRRYNVSLNPQSVEKEQQLLQSVLGLSKDDSLALAGTTYPHDQPHLANKINQG